MTRQWVSKILNRAKSDGPEAAIKGKKRGPKEEASAARRILSPQQEKYLRNLIIDKTLGRCSCPSRCGLVGPSLMLSSISLALKCR